MSSSSSSDDPITALAYIKCSRRVGRPDPYLFSLFKLILVRAETERCERQKPTPLHFARLKREHALGSAYAMTRTPANNETPSSSGTRDTSATWSRYEKQQSKPRSAGPFA
jgi:hypothetical protein